MRRQVCRKEWRQTRATGAIYIVIAGTAHMFGIWNGSTLLNKVKGPVLVVVFTNPWL
ncbi:hypothetical protein BDV10DRAFT_65221 [Aspergillus recurvatus]